MRVTIGYLVAKPEDFKLCLSCGCINWYENEVCHSCQGTRFTKNLRKVKRAIRNYVKYREEHDEHFCDECEINV